MEADMACFSSHHADITGAAGRFFSPFIFWTTVSIAKQYNSNHSYMVLGCFFFSSYFSIMGVYLYEQG